MVEQIKYPYKPDTISPPGQTLADIIEERGMTQVELAQRTGRPVKTINEIIKGKAAITSETAIQLENVLGTAAEFWNQREANYRAYIARRKEAEELRPQQEWLKQFPVEKMKVRGWIPKRHYTAAEMMICLLKYFGVATPEQWETIWPQRQYAFRKSMSRSTDAGATIVWLRQGEIEGGLIECQPYHREALVSALNDMRALTVEIKPAIFIPKLRGICAACGVAVVFVKPFAKVPVYGASCWLKPDKAMIQLSVRGKTADILWFTIFHELGHVLIHGKKDRYVEMEASPLARLPEEDKADAFAAETLIPREKLDKWLSQNPPLSIREVMTFATSIGVAPGIVVGRLQHSGKIQFSMMNGLKFRYIWE